MDQKIEKTGRNEKAQPGSMSSYNNRENNREGRVEKVDEGATENSGGLENSAGSELLADDKTKQESAARRE